MNGPAPRNNSTCRTRGGKRREHGGEEGTPKEDEGGEGGEEGREGKMGTRGEHKGEGRGRRTKGGKGMTNDYYWCRGIWAALVP